MHETLIVLHAGHGYVSFPVYLHRVLLFLLAVMTVAITARWCLGIVESVNTTTTTEHDVTEDS